jgi:Flp pilus assembly protein TadD
MAYKVREQYDRAISDLTQAIRLKPEDDEAYNYREISQASVNTYG